MNSTRSGLGLLWALALGLAAADAGAVPAFARQAGMDCTTCHMSWLELTNVGRRFKLGGYQLTRSIPDDAQRPLVSFNFQDNPPLIPLAGMIQASITHTAKTNTQGADPPNDFPLNNELIIQQASLFVNGKLAEHVGCFCQFTYDGAARHFSIDNFEVRVADSYKSEGGFEAIYGALLNNSPTMSDIYNTTPTWGWPYIGPTVAPTPAASPVIGGLGQSVAGVTAYALLAKTAYVEFGGYRTSDGALSFLHLNVAAADRLFLDGVAPYYRVALQHEWNKGRQSAEVGSFGIDAKLYQPGTTLPGTTDRLRDTGFDGQYQYITDKHRFSAMYTYIHEKQRLDATNAIEGSSNVDNTLNSVNAKVSYYYKKWYGVSFGYQKTTGTTDSGLYSTGAPVTGSVTGSPDSEAFIGELNYLFSPSGAQSYRRSRLVLQYTAYQKFNGSRNNYDGFGRNAKDNNTLYLVAWLMY